MDLNKNNEHIYVEMKNPHKQIICNSVEQISTKNYKHIHKPQNPPKRRFINIK